MGGVPEIDVREGSEARQSGGDSGCSLGLDVVITAIYTHMRARTRTHAHTHARAHTYTL